MIPSTFLDPNGRRSGIFIRIVCWVIDEFKEGVVIWLMLANWYSIDVD
jgi:hypothetical protein